MREAAEIGRRAVGGVRAGWCGILELRPRPWMDVVYPDAVIPEWRWGRLAAATVWQELEPLHGESEVWRLLERHEPGSIDVRPVPG
jgi:hypothetical protein